VKENITGIILAGGKSSRMGKDKGLMLLNGKPLVEYAVEILDPLVSELLISSNNGEYASAGRILVNDEVRGIGPMGGIYSCLEKSTNEINLVLSCDMPFMHPELFGYLLDYMEDNLVVLPSKDGIYPEPMCGIYRKEVLPLMEEYIREGNYKLPDLFEAIPFRMIKVPKKMSFFSDNLFMNINSEAELKEAEKLLLK